jgi:hypothetical protein
LWGPRGPATSHIEPGFTAVFKASGDQILGCLSRNFGLGSERSAEAKNASREDGGHFFQPLRIAQFRDIRISHAPSGDKQFHPSWTNQLMP